MTHARRAILVCLALAALLAAGAGCAQPNGQAGGPTEASVTPQPTSPELTARPGEGSPINWDRPFDDGIDVAPGAAADAVALRQAGGLSFTPIVPKFSEQPKLVQVTPLGLAENLREVVFVFNFPVGEDFPTDGRVRVLEQRGLTPSDLVSMEQQNEKMFPGSVRLITVGTDVLAEVNNNEGHGGVVMSLSGDVWVDIAGPAIPPATALKLAQSFA